MDEPCSALDPVATLHVEDLMRRLSVQYTIVIVTHNMQQAARASDYTGFFWLGKLVEYRRTSEPFAAPKEPLTEAYISGRQGRTARSALRIRLDHRPTWSSDQGNSLQIRL